MELSDAELVRGLRAGDAGYAALLVGRHRASMHVVAVSMLGAGRDVDDVVQDALLVALSRLETLRDRDAVGPWLRGITRNLCRRRLRSTPMQVPVAWSDAVDVGFEPHALESLAIRDWVWTALNELSPPLRHVIVLRYFSRARRYDAIALALGIPVGTVRSRLSEARRIMTASLDSLAVAAHSDHGRHEQERAALFVDIYDEYNGGRHCARLYDALVPEAELRVAGVSDVERGRDRIVRDIETDVEAGVRLRVLDVIAGPDITVVEGAFDNPAEAPEHCPPMTTQVFLHRGTSSIASISLHYGAEAPESRIQPAGV